MGKIIKKRQWVEDDSYTYDYRSKKDPSHGFSFPCDAIGTIDRASLSDAALRNLKHCEDPESDYVCEGLFTHHHSYSIPAILLCDCGDKVTLEGFTNTCDRCGADYNSCGQRLACRSQWGEETGEHLADILRIQ